MTGCEVTFDASADVFEHGSLPASNQEQWEQILHYCRECGFIEQPPAA